jgi:hypothetical protein
MREFSIFLRHGHGKSSGLGDFPWHLSNNCKNRFQRDPYRFSFNLSARSAPGYPDRNALLTLC